MRYFGSKASVSGAVLDLVGEHVVTGSFCDPFGGIGTVGAAAKERGFRAFCGDHLAFAHAFQVARVESQRLPRFAGLRESGIYGADDLREALNATPGIDGWLVREYAVKRRFFTRSNAERIEATRTRINVWQDAGLITRRERAVLLASLINSADRVANTAGTYYSHLKHWDRKALLAWRFDWVMPAPGQAGCRALLADAATLAGRQRWDVLYLDPPYNARAHGAYYHLPETFAKGGEPLVAGKAGVPQGPSQRSDFCSPRRALSALEGLLAASRFGLLVFHYAEHGIISLADLRRTLSAHGALQEYVLAAPGYTTRSRRRVVNHHVFAVHG
ncbi:MAG TPA: DNA adenine methylase [Solirubrobacteraceae bacterium]|jgi:adenine-specific DNA-methyltransferase|nr:DNA adenine methylase [Solirubrobacteraceae bacterium]